MKGSIIRAIVNRIRGLYNPARYFDDVVFPKSTAFFACLMLVILISLVIVLTIQAWPSIQKFGLSFFTSSQWDANKEIFGALPAIFGTLVSSFIALIFAIPISFGAAIFMVEIAPGWLRTIASFLVEMLAAIPSVIIGLWGLFILVPFIRNPVETWLYKVAGGFPLFSGGPIGLDFLSAGIILAIMIIPIITAMGREAMQAVPVYQREAMLALGATKWEVIFRAVLPYCRSGLIGAIILGLGRALGETMAVTMVIGNSYHISISLFSPGTTIASKIASEFGEASSGVFIASLTELALVLLGLTLLINVIARSLVWKFTSVKAIKE